MSFDTILILPGALAPATAAETFPTPFGPVARTADVLLRHESTDHRALIYAAKELGARRILAADAVQAVSPLLEEGDLVVPADTVDQTRLRPFTFFVGKGYGFIKLNPPFCPALMGTLLAAARARSARSFKGGVYVCIDGPRDATPAERRMFRQWGADVVGTGLLPEAYLARELEIHYGALTVVGKGDVLGVLRLAAAMRQVEAPCGCADTMKFMRDQGLVGEDWRTWLG